MVRRSPRRALTPGDVLEVCWRFPNLFNSGDYNVSPAVANESGYTTFDWREDFASFKVREVATTSGLLNLPHTIDIVRSPA